ncbi:putative secreted protein [Kluyveromyces marxianus]
MVSVRNLTYLWYSSLVLAKTPSMKPDSYHHVHAHDHAKKLGKNIEGKEVTHLFRRGGTCQFPNGDGMVAVQTSGKNAGWAMHNDQECSYGSWCPYACEPGQLMNQWDPDVTSYTYPGSQYGGLYCDDSGNLQKKRSGGYCYSGKGTVVAKNNAGGEVAFCQTVLPGNEEMLIPTSVGGGSSQTLAVPGPEYWAGTAAHYYVNPPGTSAADGCQWGTNAKAIGNWTPYVAGANMDASKSTFVKIGWNPVYLEQGSSFRNDKPSYGIKITCDDESKCVGLPCSIDPSKQNVNEVESSLKSQGDGASFCVVTAQNGAKANIEVFEVGGGGNQKREHHEHKENNIITTTKYKTVTVNV